MKWEGEEWERSSDSDESSWEGKSASSCLDTCSIEGGLERIELHSRPVSSTSGNGVGTKGQIRFPSLPQKCPSESASRALHYQGSMC